MINLSLLRSVALAAAIVPLVTLPTNPAFATTTSTFYGITVHVSANNIKVQDPKTKQTLSFVIVPKFDQVFSADGKPTYQMTAIKAGQYVAVVYDQKALGVRHADKIYLLTNANQKIGTQ